jgi:hypothetical protein
LVVKKDQRSVRQRKDLSVWAGQAINRLGFTGLESPLRFLGHLGNKYNQFK